MLRLLAIALFLALPFTADARREKQPSKERMVHVYGVSDGDTVTVRALDGGSQFRIRLLGIDAPESRQPFGQVSKRALSEMIFDKDVRIVFRKGDRYGRTLADIYAGETFANLEMVRAGMAWHYKHYDRRPEFAAAEDEAREAKRGLWADPSPTPPWKWRRGERPTPELTETKAVVAMTLGSFGGIVTKARRSRSGGHMRLEFSDPPDDPRAPSYVAFVRSETLLEVTGQPTAKEARDWLRTLVGRRIRIEGMMSDHKGRSQVVVTRREQLKVSE